MDNTDEKIAWTPKMVLTLIEQAKQRPCLWCRTDTEYSNKIYKSIAYQEIAEIIGIPAESVREKLRNLRINFMQVHKKQLKKGSRGGYPPRWEYYKAMLFIADSLNATPVPSPFSRAKKRHRDSGKTDTKSAIKCQRSSEGNRSTTLINRSLDSNDLSTKNAIKRRLDSYEAESIGELDDMPESDEEGRTRMIKCRQYNDEMTISSDPLSDELNRTQETLVDMKGSNERFGQYVTASLNNLEDIRMVKRIKAKVQLLISEAMTDHALMKLAECDSTAEY